jgi:hypothetical protein
VATKPNPTPNDRLVRLSEVEFLPRHYKDASLTVDEDSWMAKSTRSGGRLISQTGEARGQTAAPSHLQVVKSEKDPSEYVLAPTNEESDDHIEVTWYDHGRFVRFHAGKLLQLKKIEIPEGTRMVVSLFPDTDSIYGQVVGIRLSVPKFVAKTTKAKGPVEPPASA